jgi:CRP/FNR family transcriptional regulator
MVQRFGTKTDDGLLIDVPLRHQDIASSINSSRETTSRELGALVQKGIIAKSGTRIVLKRPDVLKAYLERKPEIKA